MIPPLTLGQVVGRNPFLSQNMLAVHALLNTMSSEHAQFTTLSPAIPIPFNQAAIIWAFAGVVSRGIVSHNAMMVLTQLHLKDLLETGERWEALQDPLQWPPCLLTLIDRKVARIGAAGPYYDLQLCQSIINPPAVFEGISYNLAVPVQLELARVKRDIQHAADAQIKAGDPRPEHAGDSVVGGGGGAVWRRGAAMGSGNSSYGAGGGSSSQDSGQHAEQADGGNRVGDD